MQFKAIEQCRFDEASVHPGPNNDVMVGVAMVVYFQTLLREGSIRGSITRSPNGGVSWRRGNGNVGQEQFRNSIKEDLTLSASRCGC
jgi:hypothetical protein